MKRHLPPALHHRDFALLWMALFTMTFASQMAMVAITWQVYAIHHSALDLGLIGLAEFVPLPLLALPAGRMADRVSRRRVFMGSGVLSIGAMSLLLAVAFSGAHRLWPFVALAFGAGVTSSIGMPAARALVPTLVPTELLQGAIALRTMTMQIAVIGGPALGGLLFAFHSELPYAVAIGFLLVSLSCTFALRSAAARRPADSGGAPSRRDLVAGISFVRRTPVQLGAITLDLFAVLFGGAIALAPVYATILHVGPQGLGLLRAAPALGALPAGLMLTRRPLGRRAGRTLFLVVGAFGVSMIVFGISRSFPLSLAALAVSGFVDMISMNIRSTITALATPDELRGRVNAVELVFIGASNQLGTAESGGAAWLLGTVPSVIAGGTLTIALAFVWPRVFPALSRINRLEELIPGARKAVE